MLDLSVGQLAMVLGFIYVTVLWIKAEIVSFGRSKEEKAKPTIVVYNQEVDDFSIHRSSFCRILLLNKTDLQLNLSTLRLLMELFAIILWYYLADRTSVLPSGSRSYSRDTMFFLVIILTFVGLWNSTTTVSSPGLLNRNQTEEWKGWMQVLFLLYHYFAAKEIYNAIRVFIAAYVWMTGYGNFMYYYKTNQFGFARFAVSLAIIGVFWESKTVFYTIWRPFTFLIGYQNPVNPDGDSLKEWFFRSSLDRYIWIYGMVCAYLHPSAEAALNSLDKLRTSVKVLVKTIIVGVALSILYVWYAQFYTLPKLEYNAIHPYTSWIPITVWIVLRNMTPTLRMMHLRIYAWLGCITLETYISQFHTWLLTEVPNGQPKLLLHLLPSTYPLINFALVTGIYILLSHRLFLITGHLKDVVIPNKTGPEMIRNFSLLGGSVLFCMVVSFALSFVINS